MLVEDNEINQQVAREILENEGFWVDIAENGLVAVEKINKKRYDIVLMDLQMPVLDGYKASIEIRNSGNSALPIIALSADAMTGTKEKVEEAGMNGYITKPIEKNALFESLVKWIEPGERERFKPAESIEMEEEIDELYKKVTRLNVKEGLARISGNYKLYIEILKKFEKNSSNFMERLKKFITDGEVESAARELHTIKGIASNIGGTTIRKLAAVLEQNLKEGADITQMEEFAIIENEITNVVAEIREVGEPKTVMENRILTEEEFMEKIEESYRDWETDRKSTRLNSSHRSLSRMPSSA